jgi:tRNA (adenine22-N1)-methyltransferase
MELKGRLKLIADKIPICNTICDIGTDHAYLPIYLISKKICKKAIAADINSGPLKAAQNNIEMFKMSELIETRIGNGLEPITQGEAEVIIIAGMGGILIKDIIDRAINTAKESKALILQPMNAIEILREWLYENGFDVIDEEMAKEGEKLYDVLTVKWTGEVKKMDRFYNYIGIKLIENKDALLKQYIEKWSNQLKRAVTEMEESDEKVTDIRAKYLWLIENMNKTLENIKRRD